ncbi:MAG: DUF1918 domain-containing protein [Actinomycetota bacterium]|jgi:Domain of unknown function (DUF1918)
MKAVVGDLLRIKGHHIGEPDRDAEILEVHGDDGAPPFLVRWEDGHEGLMFPESDAEVVHIGKVERADS